MSSVKYIEISSFLHFFDLKLKLILHKLFNIYLQFLSGKVHMKEISQPTFYYDSNCSFCVKTKSICSKIDVKSVNFQPLTKKTIERFGNTLLLTKFLSNNVMYYKNKNNKLFYGSRAFYAYMRDKKGFIKIIGIIGEVPPIAWLSEKVYYCIAINRFKLSKILDKFI